MFKHDVFPKKTNIMNKIKNLFPILLLIALSTQACVSSRSSDKPVSTRPTMPVPEVVDFPVELQNLQAQWKRVKDRYERLPSEAKEKGGLDNQLAQSSISYILDHVQKTFREQEKSVALKNVPVAKMDLQLAESLVSDLEAGKSPFADRKGDMHLAYRSEVDNSLQPFRLYVPENLDLSQQHPLVVGLHGHSGDENTIMDGYRDREDDNSIFKQKGKEHGFILVTPKGREADLGYRNAAEKDVLDVTQIVTQLYPIRPASVFLTGHSMGGGGTMLIGLNNPEQFQALAPIAGGLWVAGGKNDLSEEAAYLPVRFYQGAEDDIVPAEPQALESTKKVLKNFKYVEYPGEDHGSIFFKAAPEVFKFFSTMTK